MNKNEKNGQNSSVAASAQENENIVSLGTLQQKAYCGYQSVYKGWVEYDKLTKTDCLSNKSRYTFAEDMVAYIVDTKTAEKQIDSYINRMLKRWCKNNKQAYYELILSTMFMSNMFAELGLDNLGELCADWYYKLFYDEEFIYNYITEKEISDLWGLR